MIPADILRLAQEAGLIAKGVAHDYQLPVQIGRFAELVEREFAVQVLAAWKLALKSKLRQRDPEAFYAFMGEALLVRSASRSVLDVLAEEMLKARKEMDGGQA